MAPMIVGATPATSGNCAKLVTSRVTRRRLTFWQTGAPLEEPRIFCGCSPHTKGGRHCGPLFPYLLVSENGECRKPARLRPCTTTTTTARFCILMQGVDNHNQAPIRPSV